MLCKSEGPKYPQRAPELTGSAAVPPAPVCLQHSQDPRPIWDWSCPPLISLLFFDSESQDADLTPYITLCVCWCLLSNAVFWQNRSCTHFSCFCRAAHPAGKTLSKASVCGESTPLTWSEVGHSSGVAPMSPSGCSVTSATVTPMLRPLVVSDMQSWRILCMRTITQEARGQCLSCWPRSGCEKINVVLLAQVSQPLSHLSSLW